MKKLIIIDCYHEKITPHRELAFKNALNVIPELEWHFIHFSKLTDTSIFKEVMSSDGIIISGSQYDVPDLSVQELMVQVIRILKEFENPILGICFGLQLTGFAYEFPVVKMNDPKSEWDIEIQLEFSKPFPLISDSIIPVNVHHAYEILYSPHFEEIFTLYASSPNCRIQAIKHKHKPIFGVQFHPETDKSPKAIEYGEKLLHKFVKIC